MDRNPSRGTIAIYAPARAFAPGAQNALVRLGYKLVTARTAERFRQDEILGPVVRIVDDRQLDQVPIEPGGAGLPMILLTGARGQATTDARAVGTVRRRARLRDIYEVLQRTLEDQPRAVPRVPDAIPARCSRQGRSWTAAIRSLSEKGCLVQSWSELERDLRVELCFPLANRGLVHVPAQPSYEDGQCTGLVFRGTTDTTRAAIAEYVAARLAG